MADNEQLLRSEESIEPIVDAVEPSPKKTKFVTKDVVKCVVVLAVIALVAGVLLGVMNWLTYVDPDESIMKKVGEFYNVSIENISKDDKRAVSDGGKSYIQSCYVAKRDDVVIGYCYYSVGAGAKDGTISLLVYISNDGIINEISVYEQGETAGYFKRVENANKAKYVGIDINSIDGLTLFNSKHKGDLNYGEVAAVSGATYTSTGYHNAVAAAVYAYKNYGEV